MLALSRRCRQTGLPAAARKGAGDSLNDVPEDNDPGPQGPGGKDEERTTRRSQRSCVVFLRGT